MCESGWPGVTDPLYVGFTDSYAHIAGCSGNIYGNLNATLICTCLTNAKMAVPKCTITGMPGGASLHDADPCYKSTQYGGPKHMLLRNPLLSQRYQIAQPRAKVSASPVASESLSLRQQCLRLC